MLPRARLTSQEPTWPASWAYTLDGSRRVVRIKRSLRRRLRRRRRRRRRRSRWRRRRVLKQRLRIDWLNVDANTLRGRSGSLWRRRRPVRKRGMRLRRRRRGRRRRSGGAARQREIAGRRVFAPIEASGRLRRGERREPKLVKWKRELQLKCLEIASLFLRNKDETHEANRQRDRAERRPVVLRPRRGGGCSGGVDIRGVEKLGPKNIKRLRRLRHRSALIAGRRRRRLVDAIANVSVKLAARAKLPLQLLKIRPNAICVYLQYASLISRSQRCVEYKL